MRYDDLSQYRYMSAFASKGLRNFGWLDATDEVGGEVNGDVANMLKRYLPHRVGQTRGLCLCPFCPPPKDDGMFLERPANQELDGVLLGSAEIRVFGADGMRFAGPDLVIHYVAAHGYVVPKVVLQALRLGPKPGEGEYERTLCGE